MTSIPQRPSKESVIQGCALLNCMGAAELARLAERAFMVSVGKGEAIWLAGSPSAFCAVVGSGFVKLTKTTPQGMDLTVDLLGPGQALGLMAAIEGQSFPLSAVAVTDAWYLKILTSDLLAVYQTSMAMRDRIIQSIGPRLRKAHSMMSRLSSGRVEERIAAVLLILAQNYGQPKGHGIEITVPLTRSDISEMGGTTTETTIRVLSRWQKDGIVTTEKHVITILDQDALTSMLQP